MNYSNFKSQYYAFLLVFITAGILGSPIIADSETQPQDLFSLSLDELMNVEAVITTAGKQAEKVKDIPASVVIITRNEIENFGYKTIQEILQSVPGLYMVDDYYWRGSENFGVRGFFSTGPFNDLIILINGVNQVEDINSSYPFNKINVPVEAIDRIEVVRGPMSVIYGSGAFFGAINIITNETSKETKPNLLGSSYGSNHNARLTYRHSSYTENGFLTMNVSGFHDRGVDNPYTDMMTNGPDILLSAGLPEDLTAKNNLSSNNKYAGVAGKYNSFNFDFSFNRTEMGTIDGRITSSKEQKCITQSSILALGFDKEISDVVSVSNRFAYQEYNYEINYDYISDNGLSRGDEGSNAFEIESDIFIKPNNWFNSTFGFYLRNIADSKAEANIIDLVSITLGMDPNSNCYAKAAFAQFGVSLMENFSIIAGGRFEHRSGFTSEIILYKPLDNLNSKIQPH
ncbi:MAG: TonB-dependent receptor plug domain-containing protein [Candidatus Zixiibacteriota bacterium]